MANSVSTGASKGGSVSTGGTSTVKKKTSSSGKGGSSVSGGSSGGYSSAAEALAAGKAQLGLPTGSGGGSSGSSSVSSNGTSLSGTISGPSAASGGVNNNGNGGSGGQSGAGTVAGTGGGGGLSPQYEASVQHYTSIPDSNGYTYDVTSDEGVRFLKNAAPGQTMEGGDGSHWSVDSDGTVYISKNGVTYNMGKTAVGGQNGNALPAVQQKAPQQAAPQQTAARSGSSGNLSYAQMAQSAKPGGLGTGTGFTGSMTATTPDGQTIDVSYSNGQRVTEIPNGTIVHTQGGDFIWNAALGKSVPVDDSETVAGAVGATMYTDANGNRVEGVYDSDKYALSEADKELLTPEEQVRAIELKKTYDRMKQAGNLEAARQAHADLEALRAGHGYSGGSDGATYAAVQAQLPENFVWETVQAPEIANAYEGYDTYLAEQKAQQEALARQQLDLAMQQAELNYGAQKDTVNQSYDDLARQLYIQRRMSEKNMPQQMAAMGYNGGLTESSLLGLQTSYQDSLRQAEQERIATINSLDSAITQAKLSGNIELVNQLQSIAQNVMGQYGSALGNIQGLYNAQAQLNWDATNANQSNKLAAYNYMMAQQELAAQKEQNAIANQQVTYNQQRDAMKMLSDNGWSALQSGIMPSAEQMAAMGITPEYAAQYIADYRNDLALSQDLSRAQAYSYRT